MTKLHEISNAFWASLPEHAKTKETRDFINDALALAYEDIEDGKPSAALRHLTSDLNQLKTKLGI